MSETRLPEDGSDVWAKIISNQETISFEFMAANILTRHIQDLYNKEPSKKNLQEYTLRLRELFVRNSELPSVKNDINKIANLVS